MLKVSCIIPVYNGEGFLKQAIDSILSQGQDSLEILIVDDGSTDGTARIAQEWGPPVRYFHQEQAGPMAARNLGIKHAQGEWCAFLDADDLWHEEKLKCQFEFLEAHQELAGCVCLVRNFQDGQTPDQAGKEIPGYAFQALLVRRDAFADIGELDPDMGHASDTEWLLRLKDSGLGIGMVEKTLVYRRLHPNNRSRLRANQSLDDYLHMLKRRKDHARPR